MTEVQFRIAVCEMIDLGQEMSRIQVKERAIVDSIKEFISSNGPTVVDGIEYGTSLDGSLMWGLPKDREGARG